MLTTTPQSAGRLTAPLTRGAYTPHAVEAGKRYVPEVVGSTPTCGAMRMVPRSASRQTDRRSSHFLVTDGPERREVPGVLVPRRVRDLPYQVAAGETRPLWGGVSSRRRRMNPAEGSRSRGKCGPLSSAGQSSRLITGWTQVRTLQGPP